tara:strand:- start:189 stop:305 length:117 start_codon:yes stop_codon:yes gene_type:complete
MKTMKNPTHHSSSRQLSINHKVFDVMVVENVALMLALT